ncbi:MAG: hypothetical protein JSV49_04985 [Thermoplasmata archaeon]|nr:MAG: hypothetical protein JSV49_04985 [Thermoplasmata archaeon]
MKKVLLAIFGILLIFLAGTGCTLEDETIKIVVTGQKVVEPANATEPLTGIINLTIYNDQSDKITILPEYFTLEGKIETSENTKPILYFINFTILDNGTAELSSGENRRIAIRHIIFENTIITKLTYEYSELKLTVDLTKDTEEELVVEPGFFKTNYFIFILVFGVSIIILAILLGRQRPTPSSSRNVCKFCLEDLSGVADKDKLYCSKWKTRARRCGEGPFCSERCLKYHQEDVTHEN